MIGSGLEMGLGQAEEVQHQTFTETVMGKDLTFHWTAKLATSDPGGGHLCSLGNSLPANEANNKRRIKLETGVRGLERERERERNKKWSLAPGHSKANKEARLVERKICFISEASNLVVCVCVCPVQRPCVCVCPVTRCVCVCVCHDQRPTPCVCVCVCVSCNLVCVCV